MNLDDKEIIGSGGMSTVYKLSDTLAVKIFRQGITFVDVLHEYDMSLAAYNLGMPTPKPHEIITVSKPSPHTPNADLGHSPSTPNADLSHSPSNHQPSSSPVDRGSAAPQYGIILDLVKGETLSQSITRHPDRLNDYALQMSQLYRQLHSTKIAPSTLHPSPFTHQHPLSSPSGDRGGLPSPNTHQHSLSSPSGDRGGLPSPFTHQHSPSSPSGDRGGLPSPNTLIPNAHMSEAAAIRRITPIIGSEGADHLLAILHSIPSGNSLLHSDLHPRNIMLSDDRLMIIDMGEVGYGNPLIDMAHVHALMTSGLIDIDHFMGFPAQYAKPLWDTVLHDYYHHLSPADYQHTIHTLDTLSLIRCFTWLAVSEGLPQEVITRFQHHFQRCVEHRWTAIEQTLTNI